MFLKESIMSLTTTPLLLRTSWVVEGCYSDLTGRMVIARRSLALVRGISFMESRRTVSTLSENNIMHHLEIVNARLTDMVTGLKPS